MSDETEGPRRTRKTAAKKKRARDPGDTKGESRAQPPVAIRPVDKKIGEGPDNLRRRGEWFRHRTSTPKPDQD